MLVYTETVMLVTVGLEVSRAIFQESVAAS